MYVDRHQTLLIYSWHGQAYTKHVAASTRLEGNYAGIYILVGESFPPQYTERLVWSGDAREAPPTCSELRTFYMLLHAALSVRGMHSHLQGKWSNGSDIPRRKEDAGKFLPDRGCSIYKQKPYRRSKSSLVGRALPGRSLHMYRPHTTHMHGGGGPLHGQKDEQPR